MSLEFSRLKGSIPSSNCHIKHAWSIPTNWINFLLQEKTNKQKKLDLSLLMLLLFLLWISEVNEPIHFSDWTFSSPLTNSKFDKSIFSCHTSEFPKVAFKYSVDYLIVRLYKITIFWQTNANLEINFL